MTACAPPSEEITAPAAGDGFVDLGAVSGLRYPTHSGSAEKLHIRESLGQGVCWTDFDVDGDPDLLVLNGGSEVRPRYSGREKRLSPWRFYRNLGSAGFEDVAADVGLTGGAWALGCAVGDVDGDGFDDLFVTTAAAPNRLYHNRGDGTFEDWTRRAGVGDLRFSTSAAFVDLEGDSDLDLFVVTYLDESQPPPAEGCRWKGVPVMCGPKGFPQLADLVYRNLGDGTFIEVGKEAGIAGYMGFGLGVRVFDLEGDGDSDIFVANDSSPNRLFLNRGNGTFEEAGVEAGVAFSDEGQTQAGMGVDAGDLDGDAHLDLVVTNFSDDIHNFFQNQGSCTFTEWSHRSGLAAASFHRLGWSVLLEDFDRDRDLDLFIANGHVYPQVDLHDPNTTYRQPLDLLFNDGHGGLSKQAARLGEVFRRPIAGRGAAAADFDGDGDADLVVTRDGDPPLLLRNDLAAGQGWLRVCLRGRESNRQGLGARLELAAGGTVQVREVQRARGYLSSSEAGVLFGLGDSRRVERLSVRWPAGSRQVFTGLPVGRVLTIVEPAPRPKS